MWLQTPLVCCTLDHMSTLKRISGVSPSGAEIIANSWVQIFLSPRCWKARSQSRGLSSSSGLLSWAECSQIQAQSSTCISTENRQYHSHSRPYTSTWWVMSAASLCISSLTKMVMLQSGIVKCYFTKSLSMSTFFFSYKTTLEASRWWYFLTLEEKFRTLFTL